MEAFFKWIFAQGLPDIKGDWNAYATGKHKTGQAVTPDEYRNLFNKVLTHVYNSRDPNSGYNPAFGDMFESQARKAGILVGSDKEDYWAKQFSLDEIAGFSDAVIPRVAKATAPGSKPGVAPQVPSKPDPLEPGAPAKPKVGTPTGVLAGGHTIRVQQPDKTYRWYQIYELPPGSANYVGYQYNDVAQLRAAKGNNPSFISWTPAQVDRAVKAFGAAEEIIGMAGNWNTFSAEIMRDTAAAAGVNDPSLIGKMWSDKQMQQIAAQALIGDWTPEQILAEQRKTSFWTDTLYPGIKAFYGRSTEPERAWSNYVGNVSPALTALGYKKDADGTYNTSIKKMLDQGVDDQVFLENVPIFQQAAQNQAFFDVYRQRVNQELGKDVSFGDWFNVIKGEAAPELMKVAEGATLAYTAQTAGFGLQEDMLQRLINERDLSEQEARNVFSEVNQAVLALGETGLARGGLTRDDILSSAAGIAPSSGMNQDEVKLKVAKIVQEADLFDEAKVNFYLGFDPSGRPTRPGLQSLRGEGA